MNCIFSIFLLEERWHNNLVNSISALIKIIKQTLSITDLVHQKYSTENHAMLKGFVLYGFGLYLPNREQEKYVIKMCFVVTYLEEFSEGHTVTT